LFGSFGLSCVLLLLLFLLTYLGTLHQVEHGLYRAQQVYFDSWWLQQPVGDASVPLPGGLLVLSLLFVNLVVGGIARLRKDRRRLGILVTHLGIAYLLVAGFVKLALAEEGALQLFEGERGSEYHSYYEWELVITGEREGGGYREYLIPAARFEDATGAAGVRFAHDELPFELEVTHAMANAWPLPKGPMFDVDVPVVDGEFLDARELDPEAERNVAGCYVTLHAPSARAAPRRGIVWGGAGASLALESGGRPWTFRLRKERMSLPFTVALDRTARERHPGTGKPRSFTSDVTMIDGDVEQDVRIEMNEPLRHDGYVLYQSGWGPQEPRPGDRLFSVFAVVRNPADRWPLYACIVISAGLLLHFSQSLRRYLARELGAA